MSGARTPEHRQMLSQMAETWESLAEAREKQLERRANSDIFRDRGEEPTSLAGPRRLLPNYSGGSS
jgi:hypothetical protein